MSIQAEILIGVVRDLCEEIHSGHTLVENITLDNTFDKDLGLDSLARVELVARVESEFKVSLCEEVFSQTQTLRELLDAIKDSPLDHVEVSVQRESVPVPHKSSDSPLEVKTLVELLQWHVARHPDRAHIQFYQDDGNGELITYTQLYENSKKVAASLQYYGMKKGDSVAIMLPTSREYFFSFFGILIGGGVPVPIYPPARVSQLEEHIIRHTRILQNSLAEILITVPEAVPIAHLLKSRVPTLDRILPAAKLLNTSDKVLRPVLYGDDIAFIQYTSGSTGDPKGVALSNANLLANIRAMGEAVEAGSEDVFVSWLPLYHDMGLIGAWLGSLYFAALYVVMSPLSFLSRPQRWLWAIHRYKGTLSASPNFGYEYCMHRVKDIDLNSLDLSSWRGAFNGAEAVSPQTLSRFSDFFAPYGFDKKAMMPVYGLAESSVGLAFPPLRRGVLVESIQRDLFMKKGEATIATRDDPHVLHFVSSGRVLRGHEIRVVGSNKEVLPERYEGELQFMGPSSTSGYFRNPKKSESLLDGEWLNSGDLAYIADGELFITGRKKDIIIRGGRNVYPDELEKEISNIEGIRKGCVAIFGAKDAKSATERLIILAESHTKDIEEKINLRKKVNALATELIAMPPDEVVIAPPGSVLKTSSGKIRRDACRVIYEDAKIGKQDRALTWQILRLAFSSLLPQLRRTKSYLKSIAFAIYSWICFSLVVVAAWFGAVLLPNYTLRWKAQCLCAKALAKVLGIDIKVTGLNNFYKGSYVIVVNHASYIDSLVIAATLPGEFHIVVKSELLKNFFTRLPLKSLNAEFVNRFDIGKSVEDTQHLLDVLKNKKQLLFFAEGTFSAVSGLQQFHLGAFKVAVEANVPVIPVAIRGSRYILRPGSWFPKHGSIEVTVGEAISPAKELKDMDKSWDLSISLRKKTREFILRHCGESDLIS
ncbi:MAG: AMP-binding protein [Sulfurimonas sp.]|nr:AMP-binding protein [Sulfurimonas sp.]